MSLRTSIYEFFAQHPLLSETVAGRVFPHFIPEDQTLPALAYRIEEQEHTENLLGGSGLSDAVVSLALWCGTYAEADTIGDLIRGITLGMLDTVGDIRITAAHGLTERDVVLVSPDQEERRAYGIEFSWMISFEEPIPNTNHLTG